MQKNTRDVKTLAFVLKRTNYAEADRILNLITPDGKMSAVAKGVRKTRSKLAGGVEMFSKVELTVHFGRGEMGTVTSAKMLKYYDAVLKDYARYELAAAILKRVNLLAEGSDTSEFFEIVDESLAALCVGENLAVVEAWVLLRLLVASGEEVNVYRDEAGAVLAPGVRYDYNYMENAFSSREGGAFGTDEIKAIRFMLTAKLALTLRVRGINEMAPLILKFARTLSKMN